MEGILQFRFLKRYYLTVNNYKRERTFFPFPNICIEIENAITIIFYTIMFKHKFYTSRSSRICSRYNVWFVSKVILIHLIKISYLISDVFIFSTGFFEFQLKFVRPVFTSLYLKHKDLMYYNILSEFPPKNSLHFK